MIRFRQDRIPRFRSESEKNPPGSLRADSKKKYSEKLILLGKEIHRAGALDLAGDGAVHLGRDAGDLARKDATGLSGELGKNLGVLVADFFERKVETLIGHRLVVLPEVDPALNGLGFRHDKNNWNGETIEARDGECDDSGKG